MRMGGIFHWMKILLSGCQWPGSDNSIGHCRLEKLVVAQLVSFLPAFLWNQKVPYRVDNDLSPDNSVPS
jgi:hypothetical protein